MEIRWLKMTDSTNMEAWRNKDISPEGTVWCASYQTRGRGQRGTRWESAGDMNLTFSVLFRPERLRAADQQVISQICSVGVAAYLEDKGLDARIKWPNDVYVGREKICGMLIQNRLMGDLFDKSFCGIGINVNQRKFHFAPNPTSLALQTDKEYDIDSLMDNLFKSIDNRYEQLRNNPKEALQEDYLNHLLYRNVWADYIYMGERIKAMILGVNGFGHLIFQDESCKMHVAELKELVFTHSGFIE